MNVVSLLCLVAAVAIGVKFNRNCGLIAFAMAYPLGVFAAGLKAKEIFSGGWPMTVFMLTVSVGLLFGVANQNGTTEKISKNIVFFARGNSRLIPIIFFLFGAVLSGIGGGAPICAIILPLAMVAASDNGVAPLPMALMSMGGIMVGGLSPLAINGIVASSLAAEQGVPGYGRIWLAYGIAMTLFSFVGWLLTGGLKAAPVTGSEKPRFESFTGQQMITMGVIVAVIVGVIGFKQDLALLAFTGAALLILLGYADERKLIASIPWHIVLMIGGMSTLIFVVKTIGGIDFLSNALSSVLTPVTARPLVVVMGGLLGAVSSGTGVAMPTLIPTCAALAEGLGMDPTVLITCVVVGINGVVISPLSTVGAMCVAGSPESVDRTKLFNQLLICAGLWMVFCAVLALVGVFNLF